MGRCAITAVEIFRLTTETDPQARRVLEIASLKVEYTGEMERCASGAARARPN